MADFLAAIDGWKDSLTILVAALIVALLVRFLFVRRLQAIALRTATRTDDALVETLRRFCIPAALLAALVVALRVSPLDPEQRTVLERLAVSLLLLVLTLAASRFVGLRFSYQELPGGAHRPSVVQKVVRGLVVASGLLLILDNAGVEIRTLLTALGVGSIAVALALQPTLSNLFAGIHLSVSKPIRVGDYIELEDGTRGTVSDIGWRTTRIEQPANSTVWVPNARLSDMRLINYSLPSPAHQILVPGSVARDADLAVVEKTALAAAREIQGSVPEAVAEHEPVFQLLTIGPASLDFQVALKSRTFPDRGAVVHAFLVLLKSRLDAAGIGAPLPRQLVELVDAKRSRER